MTKQNERDRATLERRLEVLQLPVIPLQRHGFVRPADRARMQSEPETVGVGPDGTAYAVWPGRQDARQKQVTSHGGGSDVIEVVEVETDLRVSFVQPLPGGRVLLVDARDRRNAGNAEVWTSNGELERRGKLATGSIAPASRSGSFSPTGSRHSVWITPAGARNCVHSGRPGSGTGPTLTL